MISMLYIMSLYGTPPLNFWEKYLRENNLAELTVLVLPAVRLDRQRFAYDAVLKKHNGEEIHFKLNWKISLPQAVVYPLQYFVNIFTFVYLLSKMSVKKFDVVIGETSFGGALASIHKKFGFSKYSVYMNGDIVPDPDLNNAFYLSSKSSANNIIDVLLIKTQRMFRKLAMRNDLVWYSNEITAKWDEKNGFLPKEKLILPNVLVDEKETKLRVNQKKDRPVKKILGYIGRLDEFAGVDITLQMLPSLIKLAPEVTVIFVGGGVASVEKYQRMADGLSVSHHVKFMGFIPDINDGFEALKEASLGLALYKPSESNVSLSSEPGKPKDYIRMGLPVVMTNKGPEIGLELEKFGAGVLVDYNPDIIASTINEVLIDTQKYESLLKGVEGFSEKFDYYKFLPKLYNLLKDAIKTLESN